MFGQTTGDLCEGKMMWETFEAEGQMGVMRWIDEVLIAPRRDARHETLERLVSC